MYLSIYSLKNVCVVLVLVMDMARCTAGFATIYGCILYAHLYVLVSLPCHETRAGRRSLPKKTFFSLIHVTGPLTVLIGTPLVSLL